MEVNYLEKETPFSSLCHPLHAPLPTLPPSFGASTRECFPSASQLQLQSCVCSGPFINSPSQHRSHLLALFSSLLFFPAYFSVPRTLALCPYHRVPGPPMPYSFPVDPMIPASSSFSALCSWYITPQNDSQISQTPNHIFILHLLQIYSYSVASSIHPIYWLWMWLEKS